MFALRFDTFMIASQTSDCFDTTIIGSGFGGSILAMILRRAGQKVLLVEKCQHPKFAIGESSTPLANLLLEEIAHDSNLPNLRNLTEWGRWQTHYPQLPCGLKRGFSFYQHEAGFPLKPSDRATQLLVAASPNDHVADTHWYRPAFDEFLVKEAQSHGVDYQPDTTLKSLTRAPESWDLMLQSLGSSHAVRTKFIVDASGPRGCLTRHFHIPHSQPADMPKTQTLFAHFTGVRRLEDCDHAFANPTPPYPVDDSAVHHLIDGGWVWVLRFNNGVTSVGVVLEDNAANQIGLRELESGWQNLLKLYPSLQASLGTAQRTTNWHYIAQVASRAETIVGEGWALLPSSVGFIDPMLSTGFALTLLGVRRLATILTQTACGLPRQDALQDYKIITLLELDHTAELIGALYANLKNLENFRDLTLLYFAAASYAETVRRLGHPEKAQSFLLASDPRFGPAARGICQAAKLNPHRSVQAQVHGLIEAIDIAGLTNRGANNWYPVRADDLLNSATKVGASRPEIRAMLKLLNVDFDGLSG